MQGFEDMCVNGHTLILNWNTKGQEVIHNLHAPDVRDPRQIVIVSEDPPTLDPVLPENRGVVTILGDPSNVDVLRMANAERAQKAIILSRAQGHVDADTRTILVAIALEAVAPQDIHVVAEVENPANMCHFECVPAAVHEAVCAEDFASRMLAQTAIFPGSGVVDFYDNLLSQAPGTCEIYACPLPHWLHGRTYCEAQEILLGYEHERVVPIGFVLGGSPLAKAIIVNPDPTSRDGGLRVLEEDDRIVVIANIRPLFDVDQVECALHVEKR